jgi:hypothetical protein
MLAKLWPVSRMGLLRTVSAIHEENILINLGLFVNQT